jgi:hypothetical protein
MHGFNVIIFSAGCLLYDFQRIVGPWWQADTSDTFFTNFSPELESTLNVLPFLFPCLFQHHEWSTIKYEFLLNTHQNPGLYLTAKRVKHCALARYVCTSPPTMTPQLSADPTEQEWLKITYAFHL